MKVAELIQTRPIHFQGRYQRALGGNGCHNLGLGLVTKAKGVARLWAKREAWESHCMFPGMQRVQRV